MRLATCLDNGGRDELIEGEVVAVRPTGARADIGGFMALKLGVLVDQTPLPLKIPCTCGVKPNHPNGGYIPDVAVLHQDLLATEPLSAKASTVCQGAMVKLVVEVVSTNGRMDNLCVRSSPKREKGSRIQSPSPKLGRGI